MWRSYAALACARLGEHERARALVEEELEIAWRFGAPEPIGEALRVRALLVPSDEMATRRARRWRSSPRPTSSSPTHGR